MIFCGEIGAICYGLLGPIRRGDAVLEYMDKSCHTRSNDGNEEELYNFGAGA